jgi:hypothetical protein
MVKMKVKWEKRGQYYTAFWYAHKGEDAWDFLGHLRFLEPEWQAFKTGFDGLIPIEEMKRGHSRAAA